MDKKQSTLQYLIQQININITGMISVINNHLRMMSHTQINN